MQQWYDKTFHLSSIECEILSCPLACCIPINLQILFLGYKGCSSRATNKSNQYLFTSHIPLCQNVRPLEKSNLFGSPYCTIALLACRSNLRLTNPWTRTIIRHQQHVTIITISIIGFVRPLGSPLVGPSRVFFMAEKAQTMND